MICQAKNLKMTMLKKLKVTINDAIDLNTGLSAIILNKIN